MKDVINEKELKEKPLLKDFSVLIKSSGQQIHLELKGDLSSMMYGIVATLFDIGNEYGLDAEKMVRKMSKRLSQKE